jgi:hypothetical protein
MRHFIMFYARFSGNRFTLAQAPEADCFEPPARKATSPPATTIW